MMNIVIDIEGQTPHIMLMYFHEKYRNNIVLQLKNPDMLHLSVNEGRLHFYLKVSQLRVCVLMYACMCVCLISDTGI